MPDSHLSNWIDHLNPARRERLNHSNNLVQQGERALLQENTGEALIFFQEAFTIQSEQLGLEHPQVIALVDRLSRYLQSDQRHTEALAFFRQSTAGSVDQQRNAALLADRLGNHLSSLDALPKARALYELAAMLYERSSNAHDPQVRYVLQKLVGLYYSQGDLATARDCLKRMLALDEQVLGTKHLRAAADLSSLARIYQEMGDSQSARDCYERSLAIDESLMESDHPRIASSLASLGQLAKELGDLAQARAYYERALALDEKNFGNDHPKVSADLVALGELAKSQGDFNAASASLQRALTADQKRYGAEHPRVIADLEALADITRLMGNLPDARALLEQAVQLSETVFGACHLKTAALLQSQGSVLRELGDLPIAHECYRRAVIILETFVSAEDPSLSSARRNLEATR